VLALWLVFQALGAKETLMQISALLGEVKDENCNAYSRFRFAGFRLDMNRDHHGRGLFPGRGFHELERAVAGLAFHAVAMAAGISLAARRPGERRLPQPRARAEQVDSLS
jgi:hypothetical protein